MSENPGLRAAALNDAIERATVAGDGWDAHDAEQRPVVAVTPHGSYTFAVDGAEWDGERIVLKLREVGRQHDMKLSVRSPDVWIECSCGFAQNVGAWPAVESVREVATTHRSSTGHASGSARGGQA